MGTISLTMIVKNEEKNIKRCLDSVKDLVDEMIVVDTGSTDQTKEIALRCGAKVFDYAWTDSFADARNYALRQASSDWILVLDADEYMVNTSRMLIDNFINSKKAIGRIMIVSKYVHESEVRYLRQWASRLFPRGVYYQGRIHEQIVSELPHVRTGIEVHHDGYYQTDKTDRNLPLLLKELEERPYDPYLLHHIAINYKNKKNYQAADRYFSQAYRKLTREEGFYPTLVVDYLYNTIANGNLEDGMEIIMRERGQLEKFPDFHFVAGLFFLEYVQEDIQGRLEMLDWVEQAFLTCLELGESERSDSVVGVGSYLAAYNLAVVYDIFGMTDKAKHYYQEAAKLNYQPAMTRLKLLM